MAVSKTMLTDNGEVEACVRSFFVDSEVHVTLFLRIWEYAREKAPDIGVRFSKGTVGIAFADSYYGCYVVKGEDQFYHVKSRPGCYDGLFEEDGLDIYLHLIDEVLPLLAKDEFKLKERKKTQRGSRVPAIDAAMAVVTQLPYLPSCNMALEKCHDQFEIYKDVPINRLLFTKRVVNALGKAGVYTYGDLSRQDLNTLTNIANLKSASVRAIIKGCVCISSSKEDLIKLAIDAPEPTEDVFIRDNNIGKEACWVRMREYTAEVMRQEIDFQFDHMVSRTTLLEYTREIAAFFAALFQNRAYLADDRGEMLYQRFIARKTLEAIGVDFEISRERVRQVVKKARVTLMSKVKSQRIQQEDVTRLTDIVCAIPKEWYFFVFIKLRIDYPDLWECLRPLLTDETDQERFIKRMELVYYELRLRNQGSTVVREHLPELLEGLNAEGYYQAVIDAGKYYTNMHKKSIWCKSVFSAIAKAYDHLNLHDAAAQFEALADRCLIP